MGLTAELYPTITPIPQLFTILPLTFKTEYLTNKREKENNKVRRKTIRDDLFSKELVLNYLITKNLHQKIRIILIKITHTTTFHNLPLTFETEYLTDKRKELRLTIK